MRTTSDPLNITMLDVICNALAAVLILFFCAAAHTPPPALQRVVGTVMVVVRCSDSLVTYSGWLQSPASPAHDGHHFGDHILSLAAAEYTGKLYGANYSNALRDTTGVPPTVAYYRRDGGDNETIMLVRNPVEGDWVAGILYEDHPRLAPASFTVTVWSMLAGGPVIAKQTEFQLSAPTESWRTTIVINPDTFIARLP